MVRSAGGTRQPLTASKSMQARLRMHITLHKPAAGALRVREMFASP